MDVTLTPEQHDRVVSLLDDLLRAVLFVREATGASLKDALDLVHAIRAAHRPEEPPGDDMGMAADVLAIGPFHGSLLPWLDYPAYLHAKTSEGATLIETVFETSEGSTRSRELAACFGIDPWDFDAHALDAGAADLDRLRVLFSDELELVEKFVALREAGFRFYFRPNG